VVLGVLMDILQRLAVVGDRTANLTAQLRELNQLREKVRKAELARSSVQLERGKEERSFRSLPRS
jgi:hypothetical protein